MAKIEHHVGELFRRVGFIVTSLPLPNRALVRSYNERGTAEQRIKEASRRRMVSLLPRERSPAAVERARVQPRESLAAAGAPGREISKHGIPEVLRRYGSAVLVRCEITHVKRAMLRGLPHSCSLACIVPCACVEEALGWRITEVVRRLHRHSRGGLHHDIDARMNTTLTAITTSVPTLRITGPPKWRGSSRAPTANAGAVRGEAAPTMPIRHRQYVSQTTTLIRSRHSRGA